MRVLLLLLLAARAWGASVTLAWDAPLQAVSGYNIYYGLAPGAEDHLGVSGSDCCEATVPNLYPGTEYYFVATSYSANGLESVPSNEVRWKMRTAPPVKLRMVREQGLVSVDVEFATTLTNRWERVGGLLVTVTNSAVGFLKARASAY